MKINKLLIHIICFSLICLCSSVSALAVNIDETLAKMTGSFATLTDYTCILHKRELIKGAIREQKNIIYKFKKPFACYMKWTEGPEAGTETLFVQGWNDNKLLVRTRAVLGFLTLSLDPAGSLALRNNRHAITESHLGHIITLVMDNYQKALKNNELQITFLGLERIEDRNTLAYKAMFPENKGYYGHLILFNIDESLNLPVQVKVYGWQNELWEWYTYSRLAVNVGLTDIDFDRNNPAYQFKKE